MRLVFISVVVAATLFSAISASASTVLDCYPRAWVRAPDLAPGMVTPAQARLSVNGTRCAELVEWKVGLRMKERGIFKFHAANVTMPKRPVYGESDDDDDSSDGNDSTAAGPFVPGDIFSTHRHMGDKKHEAYQRKVREYEEAIASRSLWISRSATREVFDSAVALSLESVDGKDHHSDTGATYVRDFRVNVPNTNFPYAIWRTMSFSSGDMEDVSSVESMFEYYFLVTFADGTVVDIPAGKSAFVPASVPTENGPGESMVAQVKLLDDQPWFRGGDKASKCDEGRVGEFKIEVEIPGGGRLVAGTTHELNVTIHYTGNSSEVPVRISASTSTCTTDTWSASYAFDKQHLRQASTCVDDDGSDEDEGPNSGRKVPYFMNGAVDQVLMTRRGEGYDEVPGKTGFERRERREMWVDTVTGRASIGAPTNLTTARTQTVRVNLTIPEDVAFTYNRTLQNSEHRLYVNLQTRFECEAEAAKNEDDLLDDDLWSPSWRYAPSQQTSGRNLFGGTKIDVLPPLTQEWTDKAPLVDYKDPGARAIVLTTADAPVVEADEYPFVDTHVRESEDDLQRAKYEPRLPICKEFQARGHCPRGGAYGLVGEVWARYQWRRGRRAERLEAQAQGVLQ